MTEFVSRAEFYGVIGTLCGIAVTWALNSPRQSDVRDIRDAVVDTATDVAQIREELVARGQLEPK